ncbi:MAG: hypothetical protein CM15mP18_2990 [Methanobacteriota archaeon]|nr:MAG: hypothetical protein CM15mP18_2990 [Euryarchaeota archaeon]
MTCSHEALNVMRAGFFSACAKEEDCVQRTGFSASKRVMEATVLRDERGDPMAYTELRKHLGAVELTTVVVDPHHRGRG